MNLNIMRLEQTNQNFTNLLSKYTSSFTEKTVDDYIDMMNEF